jgi:hypothetical protein
MAFSLHTNQHPAGNGPRHARGPSSQPVTLSPFLPRRRHQTVRRGPG